jgi:hypothetical protein
VEEVGALRLADEQRRDAGARRGDAVPTVASSTPLTYILMTPPLEL